jgi:hypothetical protein
MNVEIAAEAALFPEKEHIYGIFVAVRVPGGTVGVIVVSYLQGARWTCIGVTCAFYFGRLGIRRSKICTYGTGQRKFTLWNRPLGLTGVSYRVPVYPFELIFTFC